VTFNSGAAAMRLGVPVHERKKDLMRTLTLFVALASVAAGVVAPPALANEEPTIIRFPLTGHVVQNPCTGETVTVTDGFVTIVVRTFTDSNGGFHSIRPGVAQGEAVSDTGTRYVIHEGTNGPQNEGVGRADVFTQPTSISYISQGGGDNFSFQWVAHFTWSPDGELTNIQIHFADGTCRG
jgi:hypothetical protein